MTLKQPRKGNLSLFAIILMLLLVVSCIDQGGVSIEQECETSCEAAESEDIIDPKLPFCVRHAGALNYNEISGDGTKEKPYIICTAKQLYSISIDEFALNASFRLVGDIDLAPYYDEGNPQFQISSCGQTACTTYGPGHVQFLGTFDGTGKTIYNFRFEKPTTNGSALFASIGSTGEVKNLVIDGARITGSNTLGIIAGRNEGFISKIGVIDGSVYPMYANTSYAGGLVGLNIGFLTDSVIEEVPAKNVVDLGGQKTDPLGGDILDPNGVIINTKYIGGLVGRNEGVINKCSNASDVFVDESETVGGIAGINDGQILATDNSGNVKSDRDNIGGIVGELTQNGLVSQSSNSGVVTGLTTRKNFGGLAGLISFPVYSTEEEVLLASRGQIIDSYNTGLVTVGIAGNGGGTNVGGLVGLNRGLINSSYNRGNVETDSGINVGGIAGRNEGEIFQSFVAGLNSTNLKISGTSPGYIYGTRPDPTLGMDPLSLGGAEPGLNPLPNWDEDNDGDEDVSESRDLFTATSPFTVYHKVVCNPDLGDTFNGINCHSMGTFERTGLADFSNPNFKLFAEEYTNDCSEAPAGANCVEQTIKRLHWDFSATWGIRSNNFPEFKRKLP